MWLVGLLLSLGAIAAAYLAPHIVTTPVLEGETGGILDAGSPYPMVRLGGYFVGLTFIRNAESASIAIFQSDGSLRVCLNLKFSKPDIEPHYIDPSKCVR
jgi:hypothetical protein